MNKKRLLSLRDQYEAIYALGTASLFSIPHALRPVADWCPVISEIDCTHGAGQWSNFFIAAMTKELRETDGLIFKATATEQAFTDVWSDWRDRFNKDLPMPQSLVSLNGISLEDNQHNPVLRTETRRELGLSADDVVFLGFSRLEPRLKGDPRALVVLWREVVAACPKAFLILAGATFPLDRAFREELQTLTRQLGIAERVAIIPNPFDLWENARNRLMSAADVFLHMTTGLEEACPLVVLEAMAHGLPPITTNWSGLREAIHDGETGWLIPTVCASIPATLLQTFMGRDDTRFSGDVSRTAAMDAQKFVEIATLAAKNSELRSRLGAAALRNVAASHNLDQRAMERIRFAKDRAREAEQRWAQDSIQWTPPLADVEAVMRALSRDALEADTRVGVRSAANTAFLAFPDEHRKEATASIAKVVECLQKKGPMSFAQLARAMDLPGVDPRADDDAIMDAEPVVMFEQLLMNLVAYGVLSLTTPTPGA